MSEEDEYVYRVRIDDGGVKDGCDKADERVGLTARQSIRLIGNITREIRWGMAVLEDFGVKMDDSVKKSLSLISVTTTGLSRGITIVKQLDRALKAANVSALSLAATLGIVTLGLTAVYAYVTSPEIHAGLVTSAESGQKYRLQDRSRRM